MGSRPRQRQHQHHWEKSLINHVVVVVVVFNKNPRLNTLVFIFSHNLAIIDNILCLHTCLDFKEIKICFRILIEFSTVFIMYVALISDYGSDSHSIMLSPYRSKTKSFSLAAGLVVL